MRISDWSSDVCTSDLRDGLGDIADGSGAAHKDRERLLAVLGDPHAGSFAVVAIALQLIAKLVLLHALIEREAFIAVALVPFAARIGPLAWSRALPHLHAGLGSRFRKALRPAVFAIRSGERRVGKVWVCK